MSAHRKVREETIYCYATYKPGYLPSRRDSPQCGQMSDEALKVARRAEKIAIGAARAALANQIVAAQALAQVLPSQEQAAAAVLSAMPGKPREEHEAVLELVLDTLQSTALIAAAREDFLTWDDAGNEQPN